MKDLPFGKLSVHHAFIVVTNHLRDNGMLDTLGLQHHPSPFVLPPCTPCHLSHQLKGTLIGAKIRIIQHCIGIKDAHHTHVVEVQSLRNHLRPDKNIRFSLFEIRNYTLVSRTRAGCVQVHTGNGRLRKQALDVILYLLRTKTAIA